ncbi:MAG TPA: acetolactate synthase small subunit [Clostridiales bacterium]|nr:acetolactate synthase small subunit [Clostridiales bacterium]
MRYIISALVVNHPGVLARMAGLFSRRGFNIDSLSVCESENPALSRMTIVVNGDSYTLDQITKQLGKLVDVKKVLHIRPEQALGRELLLIKVRVEPAQRASILEAAGVYQAKVIDMASVSMVLELTGESSALNAFIDLMRGYGILEMARTGLTALERGNRCISEYSDEYDNED